MPDSPTRATMLEQLRLAKPNAAGLWLRKHPGVIAGGAAQAGVLGLLSRGAEAAPAEVNNVIEPPVEAPKVNNVIEPSQAPAAATEVVTETKPTFSADLHSLADIEKQRPAETLPELRTVAKRVFQARNAAPVVAGGAALAGLGALGLIRHLRSRHKEEKQAASVAEPHSPIQPLPSVNTPLPGMSQSKLPGMNGNVANPRGVLAQARAAQSPGSTLWNTLTNNHFTQGNTLGDRVLRGVGSVANNLGARMPAPPAASSPLAGAKAKAQQMLAGNTLGDNLLRRGGSIATNSIFHAPLGSLQSTVGNYGGALSSYLLGPEHPTTAGFMDFANQGANRLQAASRDVGNALNPNQSSRAQPLTSQLQQAQSQELRRIGQPGMAAMSDFGDTGSQAIGQSLAAAGMMQGLAPRLIRPAGPMPQAPQAISSSRPVLEANPSARPTWTNSTPPPSGSAGASAATGAGQGGAAAAGAEGATAAGAGPAAAGSSRLSRIGKGLSAGVFTLGTGEGLWHYGGQGLDWAKHQVGMGAQDTPQAKYVADVQKFNTPEMYAQLQQMSPEQKQQLLAPVVQQHVPYLAQQMGIPPEELLQQLKSDGKLGNLDDARIMGILQDKPIAEEAAATAERTGQDPTAVLQQWWGGMSGGQQLMAAIGLPLSIVAMLHGALGGGGLMSFILGALGLGGIAYGTGMLGGNQAAGAPAAGTASGNSNDGAMALALKALNNDNPDQDALEQLARQHYGQAGEFFAHQAPPVARWLARQQANNAYRQQTGGMSPRQVADVLEPAG